MERGENSMINIHKGLQDYNELRTTINGVKDINSLKSSKPLYILIIEFSPLSK